MWKSFYVDDVIRRFPSFTRLTFWGHDSTKIKITTSMERLENYTDAVQPKY